MRIRTRTGRAVCRGCFGEHRVEECPKISRRKRPNPWTDLEWEQHPEAMRAVQEHPDGMTLEEIGRLMGVTRERVRQIEAQALRKLMAACGIEEGQEGDEDGDGFAEIGGVPISIPSCRRCGDPFVRRSGRDSLCEFCESLRRPRGRAA